MGFPHLLMVDHGSQSQKTFAELDTLHRVTVELTGTQSHYSMDNGERYNAPLRNMYLKLWKENPNVDSDLIPAIAIKAITDT